MIIRQGHIEQASGTGLVGKVLTTYSDLIRAFGEPTLRGGDKTTVEWVLNFIDDDGNSSVATVYDWKEPNTPMHETFWHVGGKNYNAYVNVALALRGEAA